MLVLASRGFPSLGWTLANNILKNGFVYATLRRKRDCGKRPLCLQFRSFISVTALIMLIVNTWGMLIVIAALG